MCVCVQVLMQVLLHESVCVLLMLFFVVVFVFCFCFFYQRTKWVKANGQTFKRGAGIVYEVGSEDEDMKIAIIDDENCQ